jgi:hypothetical protein
VSGKRDNTATEARALLEQLDRDHPLTPPAPATPEPSNGPRAIRARRTFTTGGRG